MQTQPRGDINQDSGLMTCSRCVPVWWDNSPKFHMKTNQGSTQPSNWCRNCHSCGCCCLQKKTKEKKKDQSFEKESRDTDTEDTVHVGGHAVCCIISDFTFSPTPTSSRNCSGSGSCRSMEIRVHAVCVIAASINALLICLGLQSSICIIHLHARMHTRMLGLKTDALQRKNAELLTARETERAERKRGSRGQQTERAVASLFVFGLGIVTVLICSTHQQIYIRATPNNAESAKKKKKKNPTWTAAMIYLLFPTCLCLCLPR